MLRPSPIATCARLYEAICHTERDGGYHAAAAGDQIQSTGSEINYCNDARPWMWASGHGGHHIERAAHGYAATRDEAMAAFAKSWRRE